MWCRGEVGARALAGGGDEGGAQLAERDELQRGHQRLREGKRVGGGFVDALGVAPLVQTRRDQLQRGDPGRPR